MQIDPRPHSVAGKAKARRAPTETSNLTQSQFLIWLGQRLNPEAPLYNMVHAFAIDAAVDTQAFERAFQAFVDRSEAFRTVFEEVDGLPHRRVLPAVEVSVEHIDFSDKADPDAAFDDWSRFRATHRFDLREPLFDVALVRLGPARYVWYLNQHHLITDAWSTTLVFETVADFYARACAGTLGEAPALPSYETFVDLEQRLRTSPKLSRAADYWQGRLDDVPAGLPRFYGRDLVEASTRTHRVPVDLGAERSARLREVAADPEVRALTPHLSRFAVFATVLFAYLYRVGDRKDLAVGTPAHNRPTPVFKQTPGLFTEVFPLRVDVEDDDTFASLHARVLAETTALLRYAQPGASLPDLARGYAAVLNYINATLPEVEGWAGQSEWIHPGHGDRRHALRLQVHDFDGADRFHLAFDLNGDVFDDALRTVAPGHFVRLLDAFLADRSQPITAAPLLSEAEHEALVVDWNDTAVDAPLDRTAVALFQAQVARTPDAVAVRDGEDVLSYADLDARTDRLADALRQRGIACGERVGIYLRRSPEAVVAMLGVLKAGAAYVPIAADYPPARVAAMLDDAGAALLLSEADLAEALPDADRPVLLLDAADALVGYSDANLDLAATPDDLAYIIYTSGSTGVPKGVEVPNRALVNYVSWAIGQYGEGLAFPLFSSLSFDLTVTSVFVPLLSGGSVVVYEERDEAADMTLLRVVEDDAVDIVKLTPSHLELIKRRDLGGSRIRQLIVGGEDFKRHLALTVHDAFGGDVTIYNEYGPTEATVGCVLHRFDPEHDTGASVPIGTPVANTRVYLLDAAGQLVPRGVAGEICIAGASLADGYHERTDLTAERFPPDPFVSGERMYRTGDLARLDGDRLVYLGRRDQQVKIRGARIELGEVEAALNAHPAIHAGVVEAVAHELPPEVSASHHCTRCGLPDTFPDATFDSEGVCHLCRGFDRYRKRASRYFQTMDELESIFAEVSPSADGYDCLMLLSGGKDSTYALGRLVDMGLRVLTFTLDNGYISDEAKANIRRVTDALGVDHIFGTTPAMDAIFVDSLERYSNVCQGCFKTVYTLGLQLARERGISVIVTGLSRGQFFETRLTEELFTDPAIDAERIDLTVLDARKAYHRVDDAVNRLLDVSMFEDGRILDEIRFVDFYRYCDVDLDEMMAYLDERLPWVRPTDTGRSTNCLINDVGIYVHKKERGFHNYALPYSWDVRMGVKEREAALDELDDAIDEAEVHRILREIGYDAAFEDSTDAGLRLAAYYVADTALPTRELQAFFADALPDFMVPSYFIRLDALPLTPNGKVDRSALPHPEEERPELETGYVAPRTAPEQILAALWAEVIHVREVGVYDNFFDLGGDSIMAIQIVARASREGLHLSPGQLFEHQTVAELAAVAESAGGVEAEQGLVTGNAPLTPIQHWFFEHSAPDPNWWNQTWRFKTSEPLDTGALRTALAAVLRHHDALRLRFESTAEGMRQTFGPPPDEVPLDVYDLTDLDPEAQDRSLDTREAEMQQGFDIASGDLLRLAHVALGPDRGDRLIVAIHHLATDGVSWQILLSDLETAYEQARRGDAIDLPAKTVSYRRWADHLETQAQKADVRALAARWNQELAAVGQLVTAGESREADAVTYTATLSEEETEALLRTVPATYHARIQEVMLTALAAALPALATGDRLRVDVEGHGRDAAEGLDVTRTVGWFTAITPFALPLGTGEVGATLQRVKERWRDLPDAASYGLLRYLGDESDLDAHPPAGVLFNYLGSLDHLRPEDALLRPSGALSLSRHPDLKRPYPVEVNTFVHGGQLRVLWSYAPQYHDASDIERAAEAFLEALRALMQRRETDTSPVQPSDFPLAGLDTDKLDRIAALLRSADRSGN